MPFLNALDFGVSTASGDNSAALQSVFDAAAAALVASAPRVWIFVPSGTYTFTTTVEYTGEIVLFGAGPQATVFDYGGAGFAFAQSTPGVRIFNVIFEQFQINFDAGAGGIHLNDVSLARLQNVAVFGPGIGAGNGTGFRVSGSTNGFGLYNDFDHCRALSCDHGFDVIQQGSNDTHLLHCRTAACTRGVSIVDSNHVTIFATPMESGTTGVYIEATTPNVSDNLTLIGNRFEGNTLVNIEYGGVAANIRFPKRFGNAHITGTPSSGTPSFEVNMDDGLVQSSAAFEPTPYQFIRTVAGAGNPAYRIRDANTALGTPTTLQVSSGRAGAHTLSIASWNGAVETETAFITVEGNSTFLQGNFTNVVISSNLTFTGANSVAIFGDGTTNGNPGNLYRKADANNMTYAGWRLGTTAAGDRWAEQFNSNEERFGLVFDAAGNLLALRPYQFRYSATNGRAGMAFCRRWDDLGTTLVNGDFALSASMGNTATAVVEANSKGMRWVCTVTVQGSGVAANPTLTFTYPEGTWGTAPKVSVVRNGGTGLLGHTWVSNGATTVVTLAGTPGDGETYIFTAMVDG